MIDLTDKVAALLSAQEIEEMALQEQFLLVCDGLDELTCIVRAIEAAILAKLQATQEPVQAVPEAMKVVTEALRSDPDYAWSWHCNVAMASVDEGMGHYEANQAAARFMHSLAGVDTTKHQGFPEAPKQEPVQAVELPDERDAFIHWMTTTYPDVYTQDKAEHYWAQEHVSRLAWQAATARAALSSRKPLTEEQRSEVFRAAESRMVHTINLPWRNAVVDEVERAHGIGLEVKP